MGKLSPARRCALRLVSERRRRDGRVRDIARSDRGMAELSREDRALALRLAVGATAAQPLLDTCIDARLKKPSSLEPRVRDALRLAAFEICYLATPGAVAVSQGVELVRSLAPRAAGLANAVLRRLASEDRPAIDAARTRCEEGCASVDDIVHVSGLPAELVERIVADRGIAFATDLCRAHLEPAPTYLASNGICGKPAETATLLEHLGVAYEPIAGLRGSYLVHDVAPLLSSGQIDAGRLVVSDLSSQLVCRLAGAQHPQALLEIGQGRATKTLLLCTATDVVRPQRVVGVDSIPYKTRVAQERVKAAGLDSTVTCVTYDATELATEELPSVLVGPFDTVLVDAPCSGSGTMRRHPETPAHLTLDEVDELSGLQLSLLKAASTRVAPDGALVYATCSVLRAEDEGVVSAFLSSDEGQAFVVQPVEEAPCCRQDKMLRKLVRCCQTDEGYLLGRAARGAADGHFCARLLRKSAL